MPMIPGFYAQDSPRSPIVLSTLALALRCISMEPATHHFALMSRSRYTEALSAIRKAMMSSEGWTSDRLLAAVNLLVSWDVSHKIPIRIIPEPMN